MNQSLIIYIYTLSLHDALPILHCTLADVGRSRTRPSLAVSPPSLPPISTTASTIPPPLTESDRPSAPSAEPWGPRHPARQRRGHPRPVARVAATLRTPPRLREAAHGVRGHLRL